MKYLTSTILSKLNEEREMNALISLELLNETDNWIDKFKSYPEIEFDLEGEETSFVTFLNQNIIRIEGFVAINTAISKKSEPATEEEAGVVEGYIEIDEDDYSLPKIVDENDSKKVPFLSLTYEQFEEMFISMKKIVDSHTEKINYLQKELENRKQIEPNESVKQIPFETPAQSETVEAIHTPAFVAPEPVNALPDTPPSYGYNNADDDFQEPVTAQQYIEEDVEPETETSETFDEFVQPQPAAETPKKAGLTKKKKIMLVIVMVVALSVLLVTLFIPAKKFSGGNSAQMNPPAPINAPAPAATLPIMNNASTAKPAPIVAPTPAPAVTPAPTPAPVIEPAAPEKKEANTTPKGLPYTENMKTFIKAMNNNTMYLSKDEKVIDIEGQDTENWIFNYKPEKQSIIFYAKGNQLKNTIIIKTNKKTYTLNLTSSNNGYTQINLANR